MNNITTSDSDQEITPDKYTVSNEKVNINGVKYLEIETDNWSIEITEVENTISFWLHGKHDGRERSKRWSQSHRFFADHGDRR